MTTVLVEAAGVTVAAVVVVVCRGAEEGSKAKAPWDARRSRPARLGMVRGSLGVVWAARQEEEGAHAPVGLRLCREERTEDGACWGGLCQGLHEARGGQME